MATQSESRSQHPPWRAGKALEQGWPSRTVLSSVRGLGVYVPGVTGHQTGRKGTWEGASPPGGGSFQQRPPPKRAPLQQPRYTWGSEASLLKEGCVANHSITPRAAGFLVYFPPSRSHTPTSRAPPHQSLSKLVVSFCFSFKFCFVLDRIYRFLVLF